MNKVIAIFGKSVHKGFYPYLERMLCGLMEAGMKLVCESGFAAFLRQEYGCSVFFEEEYDMYTLVEKQPQLLLSIGGDGTFLDSVLYIRDSGIPVLGLNAGRLGFLANVPVSEIDEAVEFICRGRYMTEPRDVLRLHIDKGCFPGFNYGLNEISVHKTDESSMLKIHAWIGDVYLTTYWADGLIIATPTGSTAYSLSGGGPIVSPHCKNIILTPVCPHNLSTRVLLVPDTAVVRLKVEGRSGDFMLSLDSRIEKMKDDCEMFITSGEFKINVVNLPGHNYYDTLRNKLGWGEDKRNER